MGLLLAARSLRSTKKAEEQTTASERHQASADAASIRVFWDRYGHGGESPKHGDTVRVLVPVEALAQPTSKQEVQNLVDSGYRREDGEFGEHGAQWEFIDPTEPLAHSFFLDQRDNLDGRLPFWRVSEG